MLNAVSRFFLLSLDFKKTAPVGIFQKALGKNLQPVILLSMLSGLLLYCAPSSHFSRSILNTRGKVKFYVREVAFYGRVLRNLCEGLGSARKRRSRGFRRELHFSNEGGRMFEPEGRVCAGA